MADGTPKHHKNRRLLKERRRLVPLVGVMCCKEVHLDAFGARFEPTGLSHANLFASHGYNQPTYTPTNTSHGRVVHLLVGEERRFSFSPVHISELESVT